MKSSLFQKLSNAFFLQNLLAKGMALIPAVADHNIGKYRAIKKTFYMASLENLEGDYLEFGVFTGSSMQAAIEFSKRNFSNDTPGTNFYGFDSFKGFGELDEQDNHPFYKDLNFETKREAVESRLQKILPPPHRVTLIDGFFESTLKDKRPKDYGIHKSKIVLIDCDTFSASTLVFDFLEDSLQEGTFLIIDDFFSYRGSQEKGTCGAFLKFQKKQTKWVFRDVFDYGCAGRVFITCKPL